MDTNTELHQIIDDDGQLRLVQFNKLFNLANAGKDYKIISIIGAQSTGKSTLLNKLFGTTFNTLNSKEERKQTTRGIWMAKDQASNLLVFDVEGSDSKERWEERNVYEQSTALFALALSNLLILNIWTHDVGRFTASNYGIVRVIIEFNMKLFRVDSLKKILVIFRDFEPDEENIETLSQTVREDILKLWSEIKKPKEYQNSRAEDFFEIQFCALSSLKHARKQFEQEVVQLHQRFVDNSDKNYIFRDFSQETNIPVDGLTHYMQHVWETIKSNKDLNLPSQKMMVSVYRCGEIKGESLEQVSGDLERLRGLVIQEDQGDFREQCIYILDTAVQRYISQANEYSKQAFESSKLELESQLLDEFRELFKIQINHIKEKFKRELDKLIKPLDIKKLPIEQIIPELRNLQTQFTQNFIDRVRASVVIPGKWDETDIETDIIDYIDKIITTHSEKQISYYILEKKTKLRRTITAYLEEAIEELYPKLEKSIDIYFREQLDPLENDVIHILQNVMLYHPALVEGHVQNIREDGYKSIYDAIQTKKKDLPNVLLKKFKTIFNKNEQGVQRNWRLIREEEMERIFIKSKDQCLKSLEEIKSFEYSRHWSTNQETPTGEEDLAPFILLMIEEGEYRRIQTKFLEETDYEYADALRKHNSREGVGIPKYFWGLLIFFMYDDVLGWMQSPYMLYPLLLIVSLFGLLNAIGLGGIPNMIAKQGFNIVTGKFGPQLLKLGLKK